MEMNDMATESYTTSRRCPKVVCCVVLVLLSVLSVAVIIVSPLLYTTVLQPTITSTVDQGVLLVNGSEGLGQFISSSAPFYSLYYILNLTNPQDVLQGKAPPLLKEIGPFVYREFRTKDNLFWEDDNTTLVYRQLINYSYDEALSGGLDPRTTKITTVNVPLIGVLSQLEALEDSLNNSAEKFVVKEFFKVIDKAIGVSGEGLFVNIFAQDLLWGYRDPLLHTLLEGQDAINKLLPKSKEIHIIATDIFGFGNLSSTEQPNRVHTGVKDVRRVGEFIQWNGRYNISGWGTPTAAMINGTGGFLFHPGLSRNENLTAFINELYRSGYFAYEADVDVHGIKLYKYTLPKEELVNRTQDPGFNANGPSGVLNLTAVFPAPVFVSKPHFLDADPGYLGNISGLAPNKSKHDSYLSAEPITGAVLDAAKRIQINLRLSRYDSLPQLTSLKDVTMLPIYWVAQTGSITPDLAATFRGAIYGAIEEVEGVSWGMLGLAALVLVVCLISMVPLVAALFKKKAPVRVTTRPINSYSESSPLLTSHS